MKKKSRKSRVEIQKYNVKIALCGYCFHLTSFSYNNLQEKLTNPLQTLELHKNDHYSIQTKKNWLFFCSLEARKYDTLMKNNKF